MTRIWGGAIAAMALFAAGAARAECTVSKLAELPLTNFGSRALVPAKIEGANVRFLVDTGAFFSSITPQAAAFHHLKIGPMPPNVAVYGLGGQVRMQIATVKVFTLDGMSVPDVDFISGGAEVGPRVVGLLGLNVLRLADDDFDFPNHKLILLKPKDCFNANLAYWTANRTPSVLELEPLTKEKPSIIASAKVNGTRLRVMFDTGAHASIMTLAAARRAGFSPDSPGVMSGGITVGADRRPIPTWIAPVESFELGGEQIKNTRLRIGEIGVVGTEAPDMILGADFFRSHHVLISHSQHRVYFTYEGGPVFDLSHAPQSPGAAPTAPPAP